MKKYAIAYLSMFLILWIMGLTNGIPYGITFLEDDLFYAFHPVLIREIVLIYNIIIMLACFVLAVVLAKQKQNVLMCKWLIPVIIFIWFAFLPVFMREDICYWPKGYTNEFASLISLMSGEHHIYIK
ncbi:MAG: hypothetical protein K2O32_10025 [Acetatifactor sp.]|nr:hypothetical protein [Acetatifactor sp.]